MSEGRPTQPTADVGPSLALDPETEPTKTLFISMERSCSSGVEKPNATQTPLSISTPRVWDRTSR